MKNRLLVIVIVQTVIGFGQDLPNPLADPAWIMTTNMSDEFNAFYNYPTVYDPLKWRSLWDTWDDKATSACIQDDLNNLNIVNLGSGQGYLQLGVQAEPCTQVNGQARNYTVGNLEGVEGQQYGYFEIRMRIPDVPAPPATYEGISANAWLFREAAWNNQWSEIDLAEIDADNNLHTCNVIWDPHQTSYWTNTSYVQGVDGEFTHYPSDPVNCEHYPSDCSHWQSWSYSSMRCPSTWVGNPGIGTFSNMCTEDPNNYPQADFYLNGGWHLYQMLWTPEKVTIWMDGKYLNSTTLGCPGLEAMNWFVSLNVGDGAAPDNLTNQFGKQLSPNTIIPYYIDIDYIRTYQLSFNCNQVINDCAFWFGGYDQTTVKKSITIGQGGCGNAQPVNTAMFLKATDFIEIYGDFTVPVGAEFTAEVLPCY